MRGSAKKTNSREAFAAVFEEQTRRFSAFELLGLSAKPPPPARQSANETKALDNVPSSAKIPEETRESELLGPDRQVQVLLPDPQVELLGPDRQVQEKKDQQIQSLGPDRQVQALVPSGTSEGPTVGYKCLYPTVGYSMGLTPPSLGPDGQALAAYNSDSPKVLAPLQWAVWCSLQNAENSGRVISYRQIAQETNATPDGVKKAVNVIQKEGGIIQKEVVRSTREQGFRVKLNRETVFREVTLNEAKGVLKRGMNLGLTGGGEVQVLGPDGLRMYVCSNINIKQTDVTALLRIPPVEWKLREQTLVQIAEALPDMTAIEFRLSLNYLIDQEKIAREPIRNHNAWVKAAFEKNKGPLVTEREIEVRFEQSTPKRDVPRPANSVDHQSEDSELLRLYLTCTPDERREIDLLADAKAAPLLKVVAEDKRAGVLEEARREAAWTFLAKKA